MKLNLARNRSLNNGLPQMHALSGWEVDISLKIERQVIAEGDVSFETKNVKFKGVWQPLTAQKISFKPEGQRAWSWYWLHTYTDIDLQVADKVIYNDVQYKVMSKKDYGLYNYKEYELILDYEGNTDEQTD